MMAERNGENARGPRRRPAEALGKISLLKVSLAIAHLHVDFPASRAGTVRTPGETGDDILTARSRGRERVAFAHAHGCPVPIRSAH